MLFSPLSQAYVLLVLQTYALLRLFSASVARDRSGRRKPPDPSHPCVRNNSESLPGRFASRRAACANNRPTPSQLQAASYPTRQGRSQTAHLSGTGNRLPAASPSPPSRLRSLFVLHPPCGA